MARERGRGGGEGGEEGRGEEEGKGGEEEVRYAHQPASNNKIFKVMDREFVEGNKFQGRQEINLDNIDL